MKFAHFRKSVGLMALLMIFAISTRAQSFPPALNSNYRNATISFDRSPSLATDPTGVYPGFYMAYGSNWRDDYIYISTSYDGVNWTDTAFGTLLRGYSPSIAFYNGYLWVAWVSDGGGGLTQGALYLDYTNNPSSGFIASPVMVTVTGSPYEPISSPTLAVYNGQLWIASVDSYQNVLTFGTTNGYAIFEAGTGCGINDPGGYLPDENAAIGMVAFNNRMYYGYRTSNSTLRVCSTDGSTSTNNSYTSPGVNSVGSGVFATVYGNYLTFVYKNYSSDNQVLVGTTDGVNYTQEQYATSMNGSNEINPATAVYNNTFYMVYTAPASDHHMWTSHN
jgi:hypothetical protein